MVQAEKYLLGTHNDVLSFGQEWQLVIPVEEVDTGRSQGLSCRHPILLGEFQATEKGCLKTHKQINKQTEGEHCLRDGIWDWPLCTYEEHAYTYIHTKKIQSLNLLEYVLL